MARNYLLAVGGFGRPVKSANNKDSGDFGFFTVLYISVRHRLFRTMRKKRSFFGKFYTPKKKVDLMANFDNLPVGRSGSYYILYFTQPDE